MCLQQFDPSAVRNYNVKQAGGSEHEIKQLLSPRKRRERRAIYRITIENVIPSSSVNGREYHTVHANGSFFHRSASFLQKGIRFHVQRRVQMAQASFHVDPPQEEKGMLARY